MIDSRNACDKSTPTGKSILIFRNRVKPQNQKYFAFPEKQISAVFGHPGPTEGRFAIVTERWAGLRWTLWRQAWFRAGRNAEAYGEVVWSWRRDAGAKLCGSFPQGDGGNKPAHRGEHEVSRKAIAQGMSECFRSPVCSCAPNAQFLAHETAGAARTRHSLRPLFPRDGTTNLQNLGRNMPRERTRMFPRHMRVSAPTPPPPSAGCAIVRATRAARPASPAC